MVAAATTTEAYRSARLGSGELNFSYGADADVVVGMYRRGFEEAYRSYLELAKDAQNISYPNLGWGDAEAETLVTSLEYMVKHDCCPAVPINLMKNEFSDASKAAMLAAAGDKVQLVF